MIVEPAAAGSSGQPRKRFWRSDAGAASTKRTARDEEAKAERTQREERATAERRQERIARQEFEIAENQKNRANDKAVAEAMSDGLNSIALALAPDKEAFVRHMQQLRAMKYQPGPKEHDRAAEDSSKKSS